MITAAAALLQRTEGIGTDDQCLPTDGYCRGMRTSSGRPAAELSSWSPLLVLILVWTLLVAVVSGLVGHWLAFRSLGPFLLAVEAEAQSGASSGTSRVSREEQSTRARPDFFLPEEYWASLARRTHDEQIRMKSGARTGASSSPREERSRSRRRIVIA